MPPVPEVPGKPEPPLNGGKETAPEPKSDGNPGVLPPVFPKPKSKLIEFRSGKRLLLLKLLKLLVGLLLLGIPP